MDVCVATVVTRHTRTRLLVLTRTTMALTLKKKTTNRHLTIFLGMQTEVLMKGNYGMSFGMQGVVGGPTLEGPHVAFVSEVKEKAKAKVSMDHKEKEKANGYHVGLDGVSPLRTVTKLCAQSVTPVMTSPGSAMRHTLSKAKAKAEVKVRTQKASTES